MDSDAYVSAGVLVSLLLSVEGVAMSMTAAVTSQDEGIKPFIQKLHTMVSDPATSSYFTWPSLVQVK